MRRIVMALGTVAALTGCAPDGPCTLSDMESGVAVLWQPADFGTRRDAAGRGDGTAVRGRQLCRGGVR
ncbi:lipoprotein [Streptomyces cinerochromogenes]|uniref:lipoprotein n=1 Tax=Streptomyces cinerochromogenes TaxID=66422 RepID=UPI0036A4E1C2